VGHLCALPTAAAGFVGHLIVTSFIRSLYEQIPSDFLFAPLGMVVGFVATGVRGSPGQIGSRPRWV
jgi:hypothetical protein